MERTTPKSTAVRKPSIEKPGTILAASKMRRAFKTIEKRPKVMIERGRVMMVRMGLIKILIAPKTIAKIK